MSRCLLFVLGIMVSFSQVSANTLEHYLAQLSAHPSVLSQLDQSQHLAHLSTSASALPNPELILGVDNLSVQSPSFNEFLPSAKVIGVKQSFPNLHRSNHTALLFEGQSEQHQLQAAYQLQRLQASFTSQIIGLNKVNALQSLTRKQLKLLQLMEKDFSGQLAAGKAVYGKFAEIDIKLFKLQQHLHELAAERVKHQESLIELVMAVPEGLAPQVQIIPWIRGKTDLFPVKIALTKATLSRHQVDIAKADFKPAFGVQALYKQRQAGQSFEGDDWFSLQASISLPLWAQHNQSPKLKSAKALRASAQNDYENTMRHWHRVMASLEAELQFSQETLELIQQKINALNDKVIAAERNYESGRSTLASVLEAQRHQLVLEAELISQRSHHRSLILEFNSHIHHPHAPLGVSNAHP